MKPTGKHIKPAFDTEGYQTNIEDINGAPLPDLDALKWHPLHGGIRPGAGRKPIGNKPVMLRLRPATIKRLRAAAKKQKRTLSEIAEERLAGV